MGGKQPRAPRAHHGASVRFRREMKHVLHVRRPRRRGALARVSKYLSLAPANAIDFLNL